MEDNHYASLHSDIMGIQRRVYEFGGLILLLTVVGICMMLTGVGEGRYKYLTPNMRTLPLRIDTKYNTVEQWIPSEEQWKVWYLKPPAQASTALPPLPEGYEEVGK